MVCSYRADHSSIIRVLDFTRLDLLFFFKLNVEEDTDARLACRRRGIAARLFGASDRVVCRSLHPQRELAISVRDGLDRGRNSDQYRFNKTKATHTRTSA